VLVALLAGAPAAVAEAPPAAEPPAPEAAPATHELAPPTFRRAAAEQRLVLLALEIPWLADGSGGVLEAPAVREVLDRGYLLVRERGDLRPDLLRRYPADGWPAVTALLPNGDPLYVKVTEDTPAQRVATGSPDAEKVAALLEAGLAYYRGAPAAATRLAAERIDELRSAQRPEAGKVEQDTSWAVGRELRATFDPSARYFGGAPRLPRLDLLEFMITMAAEGEPEWNVLALSALETLVERLVGEDGSLHRLALGFDWSDRADERLLASNARLLELYALAYRLTGRKTWHEQAVRLADFLDEELGTEQGGFRAAACPDCPGGVDATVVSAPVGLAAAAFMRAGAAFDEPGWIERGLAAARFLERERYRQGRGVLRALAGETEILPVHLEDLTAVAWAFATAHELTGDPAWLAAAEDVMRTALARLHVREANALADVPPAGDALAPLHYPVFVLEDNARAVRVLTRLYRLTDRDAYRRAAGQLLEAFGATWPRRPLSMAVYGLAAHDYFFAPINVAVLEPPPPEDGARDNDVADRLRRAALAAEFPYVIVRTLHLERDRRLVASLGLTLAPDAALYAFHEGQQSPRMTRPEGIRAGLAALRETIVARRAEAAARKRAQDEDEGERATPTPRP
jgi:uncharacterized protein YyaL (SSP411 family)